MTKTILFLSSIYVYKLSCYMYATNPPRLPTINDISPMKSNVFKYYMYIQQFREKIHSLVEDALRHPVQPPPEVDTTLKVQSCNSL